MQSHLLVLWHLRQGYAALLWLVSRQSGTLSQGTQCVLIDIAAPGLRCQGGGKGGGLFHSQLLQFGCVPELGPSCTPDRARRLRHWSHSVPITRLSSFHLVHAGAHWSSLDPACCLKHRRRCPVACASSTISAAPAKLCVTSFSLHSLALCWDLLHPWRSFSSLYLHVTVCACARV